MCCVLKILKVSRKRILNVRSQIWKWLVYERLLEVPARQKYKAGKVNWLKTATPSFRFWQIRILRALI